jgi:predicted nucleic acid-binding protein
VTNALVAVGIGMQEALSADRDFEEAGFRALLRQEPDAE